jgi:formiminotetrahydrofolate cyclodeaminase
MSFVSVSSAEFVSVLASKAAVPGGGGASALVGAIGTALGNMVGSLTVGKKKYADVEADIIALQAKATELQNELLHLVDQDAVVFEPLSKAYGIPKEDPNRESIMEAALKDACSVPMDIMRACAKSIDVIAEFAAKGSALAISDAGVGCRLRQSRTDGRQPQRVHQHQINDGQSVRRNIEKEADALLNKYCAQADKIYESVVTRLR